MGKRELTKNHTLNVLAVFIIVVSYAAERVIELFIPEGKTVGIILAMIYTILLGLVVYILSKNDDTTLGLLSALLGYKMMPVTVSFLGEYSAEAELLYTLVRYAAIAIFAYIIYKLYMRQPEPKNIKAITILAIMFVVPFFSRISGSVSSYFYMKTGSMMLPYFTGYVCYTAATLFIIGVAYISGIKSLRFAVCFEVFAMAINAAKVFAKIGYRVINDWHISKSFYVWIAVYALLAVLSIAAMKFKEKKSE